MAISFYNEKTGETVTLTRSPQISAFINSSNLSINASQGQNHGWRVAPADQIRIDKMRQDATTVSRIAGVKGVQPQDLRTEDFIMDIVRTDKVEEEMRLSMINENPVHAENFQAELKALREAEAKPAVVEDAPAVVPVKANKPTAKKK